MLPNFLIIGPGRSGTSSVTKNLMLHPEIFMPRRKSTRFFIDNFHRGLPWYESLFKGRTEKAIGEASVGYFANHESARLIKEYIPDAKMIVTLRHPVDRAYSSMGRLRSKAKPGEINKSITFEEKLKQKPKLIDVGRYATHLEYYWSLFPKENFLVLFFDQLKSEPDEYLRKIYRFLDVDPDFKSDLTNQRINATATLAARSALAKAAYKVLLRLDLFSLAKRVDNTMEGKPEKLDPEFRQHLIDTYYQDEISRLESMLEIDLSHWRSS